MPSLYFLVPHSFEGHRTVILWPVPWLGLFLILLHRWTQAMHFGRRLEEVKLCQDTTWEAHVVDRVLTISSPAFLCRWVI